MLARSASSLHFPRIASSRRWRLTAFAVAAAALGAVMASDAPAAGAASAPAPTPAAASAGAGPAVGDVAPAIRLQDQHGHWITLDQHKGKWVVLYFYPKDNTPGCTTQACEFRDNIFAVRKANAVILGVSVDDLDSHKKFAEEHGLPFSILADASKETSQRYGVLTKFGPNEIASRVTFLVDPQGRIAKRYVVDPASLNGHSTAVLADIAAMSGEKSSGA